MNNSKKFLPHLIAVGVFAVLSYLFFSPVLEGRVLQMQDMTQYKGSAREVDEYRAKTGIDALWTGAMFSGMPAYQISTVSNTDFMTFFFNFLRTVFPEPAYLLFLALLSFYVLMRTLKLDYRLSIAGAIAYAFSSYFFIIISAGHITQAMAIASAPFALAGVLKVFQGDLIGGGLLTIFGLWLEIYCNHLQITYYVALIIFLLIIVEFIEAVRKKTFPVFLKSIAVLAITAFIAIIPSITSLWSTYEYGKYTTRGPSELTEKKVSKGLDKDYAFGWSTGIGETMTLLIPRFMGGASDEDIGTNSSTYKALKDNGAAEQAKGFVKQAPTYWGDQPFTAGPTYAGAISVFLFVLAMFFVRGPIKWWLVASTILVIVISWGKNFTAVTDLLFFYLPGFNKFRSVMMALTLTSLTFALLGFLGLGNFLNPPKNEEKQYSKKLVRAFSIVGGLCLLFALIPGIAGNFIGPVDEQLKQYPDWLIQAIRDDRASLLRSDAFRSFLWITATAALLWFYLKRKVKEQYLYVGLCLLLLLDLWPVNKRYLNNDNFVSKSKHEATFTPSPADEQILQDKELGYRVMNASLSTFNDATTSYYHRSIGGYHGAKLKRYQELIEYQISKNNISVLNMLNTKYIIVRNKKTNELQAERNPDALGAAWFVKEYKMVPNADSEINALSNFNPALTAIVDKRFENDLSGFRPTSDSTATIKITSYAPNDLIYETKSSVKQLAVFSEIYYDKGWNAYVDGKLTSHFRTDYVLRAMVVPEGNHKIEFKFEPQNYYVTQKVSLAGSVFIVLLFLSYGVSILMRKPGGK